MEFTREIYWNVGHVVIIPMYLLAFIAIGVMVYGFYRRYIVYNLAESENRLDSISERIFYMLGNVFSQKKVIKEKIPGIFHGIFFWGFLMLKIFNRYLLSHIFPCAGSCRVGCNYNVVSSFDKTVFHKTGRAGNYQG